MLSLWGKEAGRGGRDPSKIPIKNPPDEHELQGGVGFYHDQWKQVTPRVKNPKIHTRTAPILFAPSWGTAAPPQLPAGLAACRKTERKSSSNHLLFHLCQLVV